MSIEVRRATLADQQAIDQFISSVYGNYAMYKGPDRWDWQFLRNPFLEAREGLAPVWIALDHSNIVGQVAVQGTDVKIGGRTYSGGWLVDVIVSPHYRGRGLGHMLHEALYKDVPLILTLTMAPATRRMAARSGAVTLGRTIQMSRWHRLTANDVRRYLVQRTVHRPGLSRAVQLACCYLALDRWVALLSAPYVIMRDRRRKSTSSQLLVAEVHRFGPEVDMLWQRSNMDYPAICPRNSVFLNWRFVDCPRLHYRRFIAYRDGQAVGYSILRHTEAEELRLGIIIDVFAARRDHAVFERLISHAIDHFGGQVASVECGTSIPEVEKVLRSEGFHITRILAPTVVTSNDALRKEVASLRDSWFLSKADHDWDQIHLGRSPSPFGKHPARAGEGRGLSGSGDGLLHFRISTSPDVQS